MGHQEDRRRQHVDEEAEEVGGDGDAGEQEAARTEYFPVGTTEIARLQRLAFFRRQRFRQKFPAGEAESGGQQHQKGKNRAPAEQGLQPAADERGDGRGQREHHGDLRHQALGLGTIKEVSDDGPADDDAGAGRHALHGPPEPQLLDTGGDGATGRGQAEQGERSENDPASAKTVGNGTVPQGHHRKGEQIGG